MVGNQDPTDDDAPEFHDGLAGKVMYGVLYAIPFLLVAYVAVQIVFFSN